MAKTCFVLYYSILLNLTFSLLLMLFISFHHIASLSVLSSTAIKMSSPDYEASFSRSKHADTEVSQTNMVCTNGVDELARGEEPVIDPHT